MRKIGLLLALVLVSLAAHAGGKVSAPLQEPMVAKSTLRTFLAVALLHHPQQEFIDAVAFAKSHGVDLNKPVPAQIKGGRILIAGKELKFDRVRKSYVYANIVLNIGRDNEDSAATLMQKTWARLNGSRASIFPSLLPYAHADAIFDAAAGSIGSVVVGTCVRAVGSGALLQVLGRFFLTGNEFTAALTVMAPTGIEGGDLLTVSRASCDTGGLHVDTNTGSFQLSLRDDGQVQASDGSGPASIKRALHYSAEQTSLLSQLLQTCARQPIPSDELKVTLQNAVNDSYRQEIMDPPPQGAPAAPTSR